MQEKKDDLAERHIYIYNKNIVILFVKKLITNMHLPVDMAYFMLRGVQRLPGPPQKAAGLGPPSLCYWLLSYVCKIQYIFFSSQTCYQALVILCLVLFFMIWYSGFFSNILSVAWVYIHLENNFIYCSMNDGAIINDIICIEHLL